MSSKILGNPLVKQMVKSFLPDMINGLGDGEKALIEYIESFALEGDETHIVLFTETETVDDQKKLYLVIGAFSGKTFRRLIEAKPAKEFLLNLIQVNFK